MSDEPISGTSIMAKFREEERERRANCKHENFRVDATVNRMEDSGSFILDLRIHCVDCDLPFEWVGVPCGLSFYQPCVSVDNQELRAPITPKGISPLKGLAGFGVRLRTGPQEDLTPQ